MTELFTFLVCLLRCPALPLSEALFHGGNVDAGDSRISTERALFLALPEADKETGDGGLCEMWRLLLSFWWWWWWCIADVVGVGVVVIISFRCVVVVFFRCFCDR